MRLIIILLILPVFFVANAQNSNEKLIADLHFYSDVMINAETFTHRSRAFKQFETLFEQAIHMKDSWNLDLEEIPFIYAKISPDSLFKIYTYHLVDNRNITNESGYIKMNSGKIFKLKRTDYFEDIEYNINSSDDWLSGICYHIKPFEHEGVNKYLLFSFSQPSEFQKRKTIDILSFENGEPVFGAEVFVEKIEGSRDIVKARRLYTYSADVSMVIQYDDDFDAIIVDHLMEVKSRMPGSSENTAVPDGTYTSYHFKEGLWIYQDAVFDQSTLTPAGKKDEEVERSRSGLFNKPTKSKN